ncbi:MAG: hypothetical protein GY791_14650 [Alphaproteobacteria bacterium]|nr:hypothetical protein [Alphaproteobacteria bacterium]
MFSTRSRSRKGPATNPEWRRSALVLCAHGVDGRVGSAAAHAARLRVRNLFASVDACCLIGTPSLAKVVATVAARRIYVVPFLMSEGYTARVVLPGQIAGLDLGGRDVVLCRPVGTSAKLAQVVENRVRAACRESGWSLRDSVLAIAGHGTPRHPASGDTANQMAKRLLRRDIFRGVEAGFLEQEPSVSSVIDRHREQRVVAVGLFADEGPHGRADMERLLAPGGANVIYGGPIGPAPEMDAVILDRVRHGESPEA